ncbi:MAG: dicarboxylate/amino acid:cation symporter [Halothiobacillaceae bacterium]|nr:dicarboxylate/amino acid:cation symporter [Halothiobacillaceae bacterium]
MTQSTPKSSAHDAGASAAIPVSVRMVLLSIALAVLAGWLGGMEAHIFGLRLYDLYVFVGDMFLNALKMLVVPLVVAAIISGIGSASDGGGLGRLGLKTLTYYFATSMLAILTGLLFVNLIQPGVISGFVPPSGSVEAVSKAVEGRGMGDLAGMLHQFFPPNIIQAAVNGQMLGLITFSLLYGLFMTRIEKGAAEVQRAFWQGVYQVMLRMTDFVLFFAPIGVFALVAKVVAASGLDAMRPMAGFMFTVILALGFHMLITLPLILRLLARVSPLRHYRAMTPAVLTAFSTASSAATLPVTIECVEKGAGVSNRTASFVLPLGATVNMDGTALYEGVVVLFIAQLYGVELSLVQQFSVLMLALMTSVGVAGIPAASLVAITLILTSLGLPLEALGLILVVDRLLDMSRTTVNVFSDSVGAVLIARFEGEEGVLGEAARKSPLNA